MQGIWPGVFIEIIFLSAIRGQRDATILEFPYQVFLQDAMTKAHLCGGVIITNKWVLTVKNCVEMSKSVLVGYGSSETNQPLGTTTNRRIIYETDALKNASLLALVELENEISFTKSVKRARLPLRGAQYSSFSTKFSGWKIGSVIHKHPTLKAVEKFQIELENCNREGGRIPIPMDPNQFCGFDEEYPDYVSLTDMGSVVSKDGIVIGLLLPTPGNPIPPLMFVKVSEYDEWIKNILGSDGDALDWADNIPRDSAVTKNASILIAFAVIIRCFAEFM